MSKKTWMPRTDSGKQTWLKTFSEKLSTYAALLGVTPAEVVMVKAFSLMWDYIMAMLNSIQTFAQDVTEYKNILRSGPLGAPLGDPPPPPTLPATPATVPAAIFFILGQLVQRIKNSPNYTVAIGEDLGIEGAEDTFDESALKPQLKTRQQANTTEIIWIKGHADAIDIYVDRHDGKGWIFLARDTEPNYIDTVTIPAGQTASWDYKAIYVLHDEQVGQYSDVTTVLVKGI